MIWNLCPRGMVLLWLLSKSRQPSHRATLRKSSRPQTFLWLGLANLWCCGSPESTQSFPGLWHSWPVYDSNWKKKISLLAVEWSGCGRFGHDDTVEWFWGWWEKPKNYVTPGSQPTAEGVIAGEGSLRLPFGHRPTQTLSSLLSISIFFLRWCRGTATYNLNFDLGIWLLLLAQLPNF